MGKRLTRIDRLDDDTLLVLAGNSQRASELRTVPFATFIAIDPSLEIASTMKIDDKLQRERGETKWHRTA